MSSVTANKGTLHLSKDLLICKLCATQYDFAESTGLDTCRICESGITICISKWRQCPSRYPGGKKGQVTLDNQMYSKAVAVAIPLMLDPRGAVVPPSGHAFTTLRKLREDAAKYHLRFEQEADVNVWRITIEPIFGIGQRAYLIQTAKHGNILWDTVGYLDEAAVDKINELGGINFIIVSHPHFYTMWPDWGRTFKCPIYFAAPDKEWLNRDKPADVDLRFLTQRHTELVPGVTAIIAGGHFEGSMMLHVMAPAIETPSLFHADTIQITLSANQPNPTRPGMPSFSFLWSVTSWLPMAPDEILAIWRSMKGFDFKTAYGVTRTLRENGLPRSLPQRVLDSAQIFVRRMGYHDHEIFAEAA